MNAQSPHKICDDLYFFVLLRRKQCAHDGVEREAPLLATEFFENACFRNRSDLKTNGTRHKNTEISQNVRVDVFVFHVCFRIFFVGGFVRRIVLEGLN